MGADQHETEPKKETIRIQELESDGLPMIFPTRRI